MGLLLSLFPEDVSDGGGPLSVTLLDSLISLGCSNDGPWVLQWTGQGLNPSRSMVQIKAIPQWMALQCYVGLGGLEILWYLFGWLGCFPDIQCWIAALGWVGLSTCAHDDPWPVPVAVTTHGTIHMYVF